MGRKEIQVEVFRAGPGQTETVAMILREAAGWLIAKGEKLWEKSDLTPELVAEQVNRGMFWLGRIEGECAGCIRYQLEDREYWDDVAQADSAFVHRLAVRRKFAGMGVSRALIEWAKSRARSDGRKFLRLDCAKREKLQRIYEGYGFKFHSEKIRKPYLVIRYEFDLD